MAAPAGTTIQRCIIGFVINVDNVEVSEALQGIAGFVAIGGATTLAVIYGWPFFRALIRDVIDRVFGGDDQEAPQIVIGSLQVKLDCFTAERFLEVLDDYESGRIKERLEKELSEFGFKVEGMKIEIKNLDKVNEQKDIINNMSPRIIVQGGVYRNWPIDKKEQYKKATVKAAEAGYVTLMKMASRAGGFIKFITQVDNVELSEELRKYGKYVAVDGTTTIAVLYREKRYQALILAVIHNVFRGDDQKDPQINTESRHVSLDCSTNARFCKVLKDHESGKITESLEKEFSEFGFKVEGLKVEIENKEEVNNRMEVIQKSLRIIVQGGVYRGIPGQKKNTYITRTKEAAKKGYELLKEGHTAVDAVEAAVCVLEKDENFNAGRGSSLNDKGEVECDAMIMEGHTLKTGAVISGRHFLHPVSLAKKIMNQSNHCALSGNGALNFARKIKFPICEPEELFSEQAKLRKDWMDTTKNDKWPTENEDASVTVGHEDFERSERLREESQEQTHSDTVSAVAMDAYGNLACAMSTGGVSVKLEGRVSDVGMVGCGGYANKTGAATITGSGESIIKTTLAREVVFNMEKGQDAQKSAEDGLKKLKELVKSRGGVIAIDKYGNFGKSFTSNIMAFAHIKDDEIEFGLEHGNFKNEPV